MMNDCVSTDGRSREEVLKTQYGELITARELAVILRYPSEEAVIKAHRRGSLPVPIYKFRGRRGWYVTAKAVAACLESVDQALEEATMKR